ncbi:MAG: hypothetical protein AAGB26_07455 [Planctomycetota bacterium]
MQLPKFEGMRNLPQLVVPELKYPLRSSTLPDFGPEPRVSGVFSGDADQLRNFLAAAGVYTNIPVPEEPITFRLSVDDLEATLALETIVAQLNDSSLVVTRRGPKTYYIGTPSKNDLVAEVFYVTSESAEQYVEAVELIGTENANATFIGDTLVVTDTPDGMRRITKLFDALGSARGQWIVEVRYVEVTKTASSQLGIDWSLSGTATLKADAGDVTSLAQNGLALVLEGVASADAEDTGVRLIESTQLLCIEGDTARMQIGQTTPIARRSVSDQGTVTVTGFDEIDTGTLLKLDVRSEPDGRLRMIIDYELSNITGFVSDNPIRTRRRVESSAVLAPGGTLILGGFTSQRESDTDRGVTSKLAMFKAKEDDSRRLFMLMRVLPIDDVQVQRVQPDQTPAEDQGG